MEARYKPLQKRMRTDAGLSEDDKHTLAFLAALQDARARRFIEIPSRDSSSRSARKYGRDSVPRALATRKPKSKHARSSSKLSPTRTSLMTHPTSSSRGLAWGDNRLDGNSCDAGQLILD